MADEGVLIVGGGLAAQRFSETLRARGYEGRIRMLCAERVRPYDRPPLSKQLLAGALEEHEVHLRPEGWYREKEVELLLGRAAARLDAERRVVAIDAGEQLPYAHLLIATGSEPRRLPGTRRFENVHALRTVADAAALRRAVAAGKRLAVIGAGFIGLEVAATARGLGADVTLVEAADAPLAAVLGPRLGGWFADLHREEGVEVLTSTTVAAFHGNGKVEAIDVGDHRLLECDDVVVGIGVAPATGWLEGSGLATRSGIPVDPAGRTKLPGVLAAGDAALPFDPIAGRHVRSEHWEAAAIQGARAARAVLGLDPGAWRPSSFWSDQYGTRVQFLGHPDGADTLELEGNPRERDFAAIFRRAGRAVAGLLAGRPHDLPELRQRIQEGSNE